MTEKKAWIKKGNTTQYSSFKEAMEKLKQQISVENWQCEDCRKLAELVVSLVDISTKEIDEINWLIGCCPEIEKEF